LDEPGPSPDVINNVRLTLVLLLLAAPAAPKPETRVRVTLEDKSFFLAPAEGAPLVVHTEFGEQRIPLKDVRSAKRGDGAQFVVKAERVSTTGEVRQKELEFTTALGRLKIPTAHLRSIVRASSNWSMIDAGTVAFWSFGEGLDSPPVDLVSGRPMKLHEMELRTDGDGLVSLARKTENAHAEAGGAEEQEYPTGDFTIEARVLSGPVLRNYAVIASKNDRAGGKADFYLLIQPNGGIYFEGSNEKGTFTSVTPTPVLKLTEWSHVAIVVHGQNQTVTHYVNGKQVHQQKLAFPAPTSALPTFLGVSPAYVSNFTCPEKIHFVRLSRVARTPEEIEAWQNPDGVLQLPEAASKTKGVFVRDEGFFQAEFPTLPGAVFKTKFGDLKITDTLRGQVSVYRLRKDDLEKVRAEVRDLIRRLEGGRIEERDEVSSKLFKIGEPAVSLLLESRQNPDAEVRARVESLLKKFDEHRITARPVTDVLQVGQTVLYGWLDLDRLKTVTKYGTFEPDLRQVSRIGLGEGAPAARPVVRLMSGEAVEGDPEAGAAIELETGFGRLKAPWEGLLGVQYDVPGALWTLRTEKTTASGKMGPGKIVVETSAGRVAVPLGEVFEIRRPPKPPASPKK